MLCRFFPDWYYRKYAFLRTSWEGMELDDYCLSKQTSVHKCVLESIIASGPAHDNQIFLAYVAPHRNLKLFLTVI